MLIALSPAKTLDMSTATADPHAEPSAPGTAAAALTASFPPLSAAAYPIARHMQGMSVGAVKSALGLSDQLAKLNAARYKAFVCGESPGEGDSTEYERAVLGYNGDAYCPAGMDARTFSGTDFEFAHEHLRIISGWYGLVRAADYIQPYRLCMGTKLPFRAPGPDGKQRAFSSLYEYWRPRITEHLLAELEAARAEDGGEPFVVNLASQEYWKAVDEAALRRAGVRVVACSFLNDGRSLSVYSKKARGLMARYIIQNRVTAVDDLRRFDLDNYKLDAARSSDAELVFARPKPPPSCAADRAAAARQRVKAAVAPQSTKTAKAKVAKAKASSKAASGEASRASGKPTAARKKAASSGAGDVKAGTKRRAKAEPDGDASPSKRPRRSTRAR